jgi:hypothetical protein
MSDRPKILSFFWLSNEALVNLGDYLTVPLLGYMGYDFLDIAKLSPEELGQHPLIVCTIGTILNRGMYLQMRGKKGVVWGSGTQETWDALTPKELHDDYDFRAVRGPRTRAQLGLDPSIPMGDPALILPRYFPISPKERSGILGIPHWANRGIAQSHKAYQGTELLNIVHKQGDWKPKVEKIASAEFVLTNALHGAIIAQAYGVPWAFCSAEGERISCVFKWLDWFEYLDLDLRVVRTLSEGMSWWDRVGQFAKTPDIQQLIDAFPHDCSVNLANVRLH